MACSVEKLAYLSIGIVLTSILYLFASILPNHYEHQRIFKREGKPAIIRGYRVFGIDDLSVEDPNKNIFIPYEKYLKNIKDPNMRKIEESEIKRLVNW